MKNYLTNHPLTDLQPLRKFLRFFQITSRLHFQEFLLKLYFIPLFLQSIQPRETSNHRITYELNNNQTIFKPTTLKPF